MNRAQGLIFVQKPDPGAPPPLCKVSDAVGNLYVAADVVLNADGLAVTTVSGARVTLPDAKRLANLSREGREWVSRNHGYERHLHILESAYFGVPARERELPMAM